MNPDDLTPEQVKAEAEALREQLEQADREDAPFFLRQMSEEQVCGGLDDLDDFPQMPPRYRFGETLQKLMERPHRNIGIYCEDEDDLYLCTLVILAGQAYRGQSYPAEIERPKPIVMGGQTYGEEWFPDLVERVVRPAHTVWQECRQTADANPYELELGPEITDPALLDRLNRVEAISEWTWRRGE